MLFVREPRTVNLFVTGAVVAPAEYDWLEDGDVVTMEAVGLGTLENTVRRPA